MLSAVPSAPIALTGVSDIQTLMRRKANTVRCNWPAPTLRRRIQVRPSLMRLRVRDAAAKGRYGFTFIGEGGDGLDEACQFEDFLYVAAGV